MRAQISNQEFNLLFINCLCYGRSDKFKKLVEKYSFFEHVYYNEIAIFVDALNENLGFHYGDGSTVYSLEDVQSLYLPSAFDVLNDA
ncbi:putative phage abortive infection protein [Aeromonas sp. 30P]|uniref:putative phage abortive infection protein n=1 Tax=Aeromonas sp. 30P TaxID=3452717 RepID=UPI003F7935AD